MQPLTIPKQNSAQGQFFLPNYKSTDREAWLKSVKEYFPTNEYFVNRAKQELARYYLQHNRLDDAYHLFSELARLDDSQPENRAFGLAGQSIVLAMQGRHEEAIKVLAQLGPLRSKLDPRMAGLLVYPLSLVQKAMDKKTADQWQQWTSKLPKEEPSEPEAGDQPLISLSTMGDVGTQNAACIESYEIPRIFRVQRTRLRHYDLRLNRRSPRDSRRTPFLPAAGNARLAPTCYVVLPPTAMDA